MKRKWIRRAPFIIAAVLLGMAAFTGVVMMLWNSILPVVFHVGAITFWQAAGILLLCKILFGSFRRPWHRGMWKQRMFMKWESMTPEEKEQFRSRMHGCGRGWHDKEAMA